MKELKPCPFCGGEAILGDIRMTTLAYSPRIRTTYRRVFCENCGAATKSYETEKNAINAWNSRAQEASE